MMARVFRQISALVLAPLCVWTPVASAQRRLIGLIHGSNTRQHDGMLSVHESPEGGARFMLDMPRLLEEPEMEPPLQAI